MTDERTFSDERVGEILRRAVELQHDGAVPMIRGEGLSQSELERVAGEAGIDPIYVRRAIAESGTSSPDTEPSRFMGEAKTIEVTGFLQGEVSPEAMKRMVEEVQRTFADTAEPAYTDSSATWTGSSSLAASRLSKLMVAITARNGETEIRITEQLDNLSTLLFGALGVAGSAVGVGISGAIGMGEFGSPLIFAAGAVTVASSLYGVARTLYTKSARKRRRELQRLVARMVEVSISDGGLQAIPESTRPDSGADPTT
jgi:hypothetical protein